MQEALTKLGLKITRKFTQRAPNSEAVIWKAILQGKDTVKSFTWLLRLTIINSLFPVLVREKYHAGGRLLFIILLKTIIISRINATYTLGHINV